MFLLVLAILSSTSQIIQVQSDGNIDAIINNIAFEVPDIAVTLDTNQGQYHMEAFRSITNDDILREPEVPRASELMWVSIGQPSLVKTPTIEGDETKVKLLHLTNYGFYVYFNMLTDEHRHNISESASMKYRIEVHDGQVVNLILSKFECTFPLYDSSFTKYLVKGTVTNFRTFPLRMDFIAPPNSMERSLLIGLLGTSGSDSDINVMLTCSMSSAGKKLLTNTLTITSRTSEQIGLSEKLFGSSSSSEDSVYVTRQQTAELSREMYSALNIVEEYEIPEFEFSEAFVSDLISLTAESTFGMVPIDEVLSALSSYVLDFSADVQPDVIKRDLGSILEIDTRGEKSRIITDERVRNENEDSNSFSTGVGFSYLGISTSVNFGLANSQKTLSETESLNDQLHELNTASKDHVEWEIEGNKVIPKNLNVARLLRMNFDSTLAFRRVRLQKLDAPFHREFSVYTNRARMMIPPLEHLNVCVSELSTKLTSSITELQRYLTARFHRDINECAINPCRNGGSCINSPSGSYTCRCASGNGGRNCENDCPRPFQYFSDVIGCYYVITDELTWSDAASRCQSYNANAHLVVIDDAAEQSTLESLSRSTPGHNCSQAEACKSIYIAGRRLQTGANSEFIWKLNFSNGTVVEKPMNYTYWNHGEPNDSGIDGESEDCVEMQTYMGYTWNDRNCKKRMHAICELDMN